jgi:hypothetical protein
MTPEELTAHEAIRQTLARYCRGVDRGDSEMLLSVYHEGAIDNHGAFNGAAADFATMLIEGMDASPIVGQHHITNVLIELDGNDKANVESYYVAWHPVPMGAEGDWGHVMVGGRYLDRFENRDGDWRIARRDVLMDWSNEPMPAVDWAAATSFPAGGRRDADPSSAFFER